MKTVLLAILLFCIMIFPHELGHFITAKKCGVKVNEFAFGMGPVIWKKQKGETLYSIRLFPIGGFCAMEGEDGDSGDERSFEKKKPWQKLLILAAGSLMNVICAILIMCLIVGIRGFTTTTLGSVEVGSPAELAGLMPRDKIVSMTTGAGRQQIDNWTQVSETINGIEAGEGIEIEYKRGSELHLTTIVPVLTESVDSEGNQTSRYLVGISCKISHNPAKAVLYGAQSTWEMTKLMFSSIAQLINGQASADDLTGPVGMVQMVSQTAQYGYWYYGFLTALICINLAVVNMLPFPALDGGRIIFVLYSAVTGRRVSEKLEGSIHFAGLALLMLLMLYVTLNDVGRIFG